MVFKLTDLRDPAAATLCVCSVAEDNWFSRIRRFDEEQYSWDHKRAGRVFTAFKYARAVGTWLQNCDSLNGDVSIFVTQFVLLVGISRVLAADVIDQDCLLRLS